MFETLEEEKPHRGVEWPDQGRDSIQDLQGDAQRIPGLVSGDKGT